MVVQSFMYAANKDDRYDPRICFCKTVSQSYFVSNFPLEFLVFSVTTGQARTCSVQTSFLIPSFSLTPLHCQVSHQNTMTCRGRRLQQFRHSHDRVTNMNKLDWCLLIIIEYVCNMDISQGAATYLYLSYNFLSEVNYNKFTTKEKRSIPN